MHRCSFSFLDCFDYRHCGQEQPHDDQQLFCSCQLCFGLPAKSAKTKAPFGDKATKAPKVSGSGGCDPTNPTLDCYELVGDGLCKDAKVGAYSEAAEATRHFVQSLLLLRLNEKIQPDLQYQYAHSIVGIVTMFNEVDEICAAAVRALSHLSFLSSIM